MAVKDCFKNCFRNPCGGTLNYPGAPGESISKKTVLLILLMLGLASYLRIESVISTHVIAPFSTDAKEYAAYAYNLRHHHTYSRQLPEPGKSTSRVVPDAKRPPGYPLYLSLFVYSVPNEEIVRRICISQAILSTVSIFIFFMFYHRFLPLGWSILATLFVTVSPHLIVLNSYLLTETLFCLFLALVAVTMTCVAENPNFKSGFVLGASIALASLVRLSLQYFPLVLSVFLLCQCKSRKRLRVTAGMLIGFALLFSPWVLRNSISLERPPDKTAMINFLHHGMYPDFTYNDRPETYGFPYLFDPRTADIGRSVPAVLTEIVQRFFHDPLKYAGWYFFSKPMTFWSWAFIQGSGIFVYRVSDSPYFSTPLFLRTHTLMQAFHGVIVAFGLIGSLAVWLPFVKRRLSSDKIVTARFASMILIYFTLLHMIGTPFPRYAVPERPILYGMALVVPYIFILVLKEKNFWRKSRSAATERNLVLKPSTNPEKNHK